MENFFTKLNSYQLLANLLPGIVLYYFLSLIFDIKDTENPFIIKLCIFYFIGLVCSRVGSIIIEPICKKSKKFIFANYKDYIKAQQVDKYIDAIVETSSMYRTFLAGFVILLIITIIYILYSNVLLQNYIKYILLFVSFIILFLLSYKKQTNYITKRIKKTVNMEEDDE